ncbi:MAG TPA: ferredoxin [Ilumatobacteraceae bacterium]|nr:ferredoxin [Ilumatobacteraceae bacterium]
MTETWTVRTDRDSCMGTGMCAFLAPHVFDVDSTGRVTVIGPVTAGDDAVRQAVEACPMSALELIITNDEASNLQGDDQ